jgi:hypothetical protein
MQGAMQTLLLVRFEQAAIAAFGEEQGDFVGRMQMAVRGGAGAERPQEHGRCSVEQGSKRPERGKRPLHGPDGQECDLRGELQRQRLGDEFRNDDLHGRQRREDAERGRRPRHGRMQRKGVFERRGECDRQRRFGHRAEEKAGDGDADL